MAAEWQRLWAEAQQHGSKEEWKEQMCVLARMVPLTRRMGDLHKESSLWANLGMCRQRLGLHDKALESFETYRGLCEQLGDQHRVGVALARMAECQAALGRPEEAEQTRLRAEQIKEEVAARKRRDRAAAIGGAPAGGDALKRASLAADIQRHIDAQAGSDGPPAAPEQPPAEQPPAERPEAAAAPGPAPEAAGSSGSDSEHDQGAETAAKAKGGKGKKKKKDGKKKKPAPKQAGPRSVVQAVADLEKQVADEEDLRVITGTLMHHVRCVQQFPDEWKYRVVSSQSKTYRSKLGRHPACQELLRLLGFKLNGTGDWHLPADARLDRESCELLELYDSGLQDTAGLAPVSLRHMVRPSTELPAAAPKRAAKKQQPAQEAAPDPQAEDEEAKRQQLKELQKKYDALWAGAVAYQRKDEHQLHIEALEGMLPLACAMQCTVREAQVRSCLGVAFREMARYEAAIAHFTRALELNESHGDIRKTLSVIRHIGETHQAAQDYPAALRVYKQFLVLSDGDRKVHPEKRLEVEANIVACVRQYF